MPKIATNQAVADGAATMMPLWKGCGAVFEPDGSTSQKVAMKVKLSFTPQTDSNQDKQTCPAFGDILTCAGICRLTHIA